MPSRIFASQSSEEPHLKGTYDWRSFAALACCSIGCLVIAGCGAKSDKPFDLSRATYVGESSCVTCHQDQAKSHQGSHHDLAMQMATEDTVLGDFDNTTITHHDIESKFFRDGDKFMVNTEGPDGVLQDFEIKYVFGVEPLQQYMVEFPASEQTLGDSEAPRVQVLRLCWNTPKKEWFYLPPPDVPEKLAPNDDLHWTGIAQRWNNMCAECHSTDYKKNFSPPEKAPHFVSTEMLQANEVSDSPLWDLTEVNTTEIDTGHYKSSFLEINVSCEACHGPGSVHIELADQWFPGWNRERGYGLANLKATAENQIQACAPCHSRRNVVQAGFKAFDNYYDFYTNSLLTEDVYYPDGQVLDEDYVHGSFIQSKMYHKGIKCTDCHDPHTAKLKHNGNQVCTSCHQHPAAKYDSVAHHFHKPESEGAQCVNCHMPSTTYMAVDARRDHSFRIPRPDLSTDLGTPNACTGCHLDKNNIPESKRNGLVLYQDWMLAARNGDQDIQAELERANQWCDDACNKWYGEKRRRDNHFGIAISAGQQRKENSVELLRDLLGRRGPEAPAIARATALQVLMSVSPRDAAEMAERAIEDDHPLVRSSATTVLSGGSSLTKSIRLIEKALKDPIRSVRTEAARNLLDYPSNMWSDQAGAAFRNALSELIEGLQYNNDRAGAHLALGILSEQQGHQQQAMGHYESAIGVEPTVTGPRTNLAALLENTLLARNATTAEGSSPLELEVRRLRKEELPLLARDVNLLPSEASIQYRYGLALYVDDQKELAAEHLVKAAELEPETAAYAQAAAMIFESMEKWEEAISWGKQAVDASNGDPQAGMLLNRIKSSAAQSSQ